MNLTSPTINRLLTWFAVMMFGAFAGHVYSIVFYDNVPERIAATWPGIRGGIAISGLSSGFELFVMRSRIGVWLKRRSFMTALILRILIHSALITTGLLLNRIISGLLVGGFVENSFSRAEIAQDLFYSLLITGLVLFVLQARTLIGGRTLLNVLLGRYRHPVKENRIFVLIDLAGSTPLAAHLGDEGFHAFLSAFFFEIDPAITQSGGEVHSYVGDAVIATWPLGTSERNARAINAIFDAREIITKRSSWFKQKFDHIPIFRAVIHGGPVVAGECGDSRRQITYLGDVLNTAARIESLAKSLDVETVISEQTLRQVSLPGSISSTSLGRHALKGLSQPIAVHSLQREPI